MSDQVKKRTIILDAGHGGPDPGAIGPTGLKESEVVQAVTDWTLHYLENAKPEWRVFRTRLDDSAMDGKRLSLKNRVKVGKIYEADLFVSIHANSSESKQAHGFEVFYGTDKGFDPAVAIYARMKERLKSHRGRGVKKTRSKVYKRSLYVVDHNPVPSILVELEFISNPEQEAIFRKAASIKFYGKTLALGIIDYFKFGVGEGAGIA